MAKINAIAKIYLKKFSLYLLGHLREKNQRSEKHLSPIWNFRGVKFNRFQKFFSVHLLQVLARCVLADFEKFFSFGFFHGTKIENAKHRRLFSGIKNAPSIFETRAQHLCGYSVVRRIQAFLIIPILINAFCNTLATQFSPVSVAVA